MTDPSGSDTLATGTSQARVALVTGASRGIGAAIAVELAMAGWDVAVCARDEALLAGVCARIAALGRRALAVPADLSGPGAGAVVDQAVGAFGRLDLLVNSAGATKRGDFLRLTDADWASGYELKLFGAMRLCRAAWPHLVQAKGQIITIAGVGARTPSADFTIGGSVNAALINAMKALADRGRDAGIRVNTINPGYVATERLTGRLDKIARERAITRDDAAKELLDSIGVSRFAEPEEVGALVVYIASAKGRYINGTAIDIDGGWTRGI